MKKMYSLFLITFCIILSAQDVTVKDSIISQDSSEIQEFKLFPNPVSQNTLYITTKDNAIKDIIVYNVFGEMVLKKQIKTTELDVSKLISGMYLMQVTENNKTITRKLVVK